MSATYTVLTERGPEGSFYVAFAGGDEIATLRADSRGLEGIAYCLARCCNESGLHLGNNEFPVSFGVSRIPPASDSSSYEMLGTQEQSTFQKSFNNFLRVLCSIGDKHIGDGENIATF